MKGNQSVQVVIKDLSDHPVCTHGPTLLFCRQNAKFYACSACRNRKDCSFFMREEDWIRKKKNYVPLPKSPVSSQYDIEQILEKVKAASNSDKAYCHTCSLLFLVSEDYNSHVHHDVLRISNPMLLSNPSSLLKPLENDKKEAQYLFSDKSIETVVNILVHNNLKNIICLGTPRMHEYIQQNGVQNGMSSILLDMDSRHKNFYDANKFCHYNIFNNYFFNGNEELKHFEYFLQCNKKDNLCIIIDPPFGGRIEPLGQTLSEISNLHRKVNDLSVDTETLLPIILVSPYFMEPQIKNHIPDLEMSDYQVTYKNHSNFKDKVLKHGSPVRFYTNIPLKKFKLKSEDGYHFCKPCVKWVGNWNKHCLNCKCCPSKNGSTYKHCDLCQRCVKQSWEHCNQCSRCCLKEHDCGIILIDQICFNCKEKGHKKAFCPKLEVNQSKKRKNENECDTQNKKLCADIKTKSNSKNKIAQPKRNKKKERKIRIHTNRNK